MTFPPTSKQARALMFIAGYIEAHGFAPSTDEILQGLSLTGRSNADRIKRGLIDRGLLESIPNRARAIRPTSRVSIPRAPDGAPLYFVAGPTRLEQRGDG